MVQKIRQQHCNELQSSLCYYCLSNKVSFFIVYYNVYWFINSTDDIQMKDSPAYETVPQTQLAAVWIFIYCTLKYYFYRSNAEPVYDTTNEYENPTSIKPTDYENIPIMTVKWFVNFLVHNWYIWITYIVITSYFVLNFNINHILGIMYYPQDI